MTGINPPELQWPERCDKMMSKGAWHFLCCDTCNIVRDLGYLNAEILNVYFAWPHELNENPEMPHQIGCQEMPRYRKVILSED